MMSLPMQILEAEHNSRKNPEPKFQRRNSHTIGLKERLQVAQKPDATPKSRFKSMHTAKVSTGW